MSATRSISTQQLKSALISIKQWVYLLPTLVLYIPFVLFPIIFLFALSFYTWGGGLEQTFVGFSHYQNTLQNDVFYISVWHNFVILAINLVVHTVGSLGIAIAIRKSHQKLQPLFQTALLLPLSMMAVAVALLWTLIYNPQIGVINAALGAIGIAWQPIWLGDPTYALFAVILTLNWYWFGFWVIIWLVGLSTIDDRYYEAAMMDGAGRLQTFWYVTLPQLKESAVFVVTLTTINAIRQFGLFWVMTEGGPGRATEILLTWIFKIAFDIGSFGQAAAVTVFLFLIIVVFSLVNLKLTGAGGGTQ